MTTALRRIGLGRKARTKTKREDEYRPPIFWHRLWVLEILVGYGIGFLTAPVLWITPYPLLIVLISLVIMLAFSKRIAYRLQIEVRRAWCRGQIIQVCAFMFPGMDPEEATFQLLGTDAGVILAEMGHYMHAVPGCSQSMHREPYDGDGIRFGCYHKGQTPRRHTIFPVE